jgi:hypothetical protein
VAQTSGSPGGQKHGGTPEAMVGSTGAGGHTNLGGTVLLGNESRRWLRNRATPGPRTTIARSTLVGVALIAVLVLASCTASWEISQPGRSTTTSTPQRPTTTRPTTTTTRPTTTTTRPTTTTSKPPTTTTAAPPNITTVAPDGGNGPGQPFDQPGRHLPNDHAYFPLAVWLEEVHNPAEIAQLADKGINTFEAIVASSDLNAIEASGMKLIAQVDDFCTPTCRTHPAIDGWLLYDEPDLMYGGGNDAWSGKFGWNTCIPPQDQGGHCGYTFLNAMKARVPAGDMTKVNFGLFMLPTPGGYDYGNAVCSAFDNGWGDIVGMDYYGFTHPGRSAFTMRGAFYGLQIDRMRACDAMAGGTAPADRKPVWAVVDLGAPFGDGGQITPPQMRSATWHSIIAGARGVLYFNHSFGGTCQTFTVLRDGCSLNVTMQAAVKALNAQITQLAPVLNSATATGYVTTSPNIRATAKVGGADAPFGTGIYTIAGATWSGGGSQQATITINPAAGPTPGTASVLFEGRTVPIVAGKIVDTFADGNAIHIYKW